MTGGDGRREQLSSLHESEAAREDFSWAGWVLLRLANVDPRDVVSHSDRVAYRFIGCMLLVFALYALLGWTQFLSRVGLHRLGEETGIALQLAGAAIATFAIVSFDRFLIGRTQPKFEYSMLLPPEYEVSSEGELDHLSETDAPDEDDEPEARIDHHRTEAADAFERRYIMRSRQAAGGTKIPNLVGGRMWLAAIGRLMIALIIAFFVTQAVSDFIFRGDIERQRADNKIAELRGDVRAEDERYQRAVQRNADETGQQLTIADRAQRRMKEVEHALGHGCPLPKDRKTVCGKARAAYLAALGRIKTLKARNPRQPKSRPFQRHEERIGELRHEIATIDDDPGSVPAENRGGVLEPSRELEEYLDDHPGASRFHTLVLVLLILIDLGAITAKLVCHNSEYERRQAFRRWLAWSNVRLGEGRRQEETVRQLRSESSVNALQDALTLEAQLTELHRTRAAEHALRDALDRAPAVEEEADEAALHQVAAKLRDQTPGPPADPPPDPGPGPVPASSPTSLRRDVVLRGQHQWTLVALADRGGHGAVWLGRGGPDGRNVAIKIMPLGAGDDAVVQSERVTRERRWLKDFEPSRHLLRILDSGGEPGVGAWYVMDWADLGSLADYYADPRRAARSLGEVLSFASQILEGLFAAADAVHGDMKPQNLLLFSNADRSLRGAPLLAIADWSLVTGHGEPRGMAIPEQGTVEFAADQALFRGGEPVSIVDDLFSLGAILWWAITGAAPGTEGLVRPAVGGAPYERYVADVRSARAALPSLSVVMPHVPSEVAAFVGRLLARDRAMRVEEVPEELGGRSAYLRATQKRLHRMINTLEAGGRLDILVGPATRPRPRAQEPPRDPGGSEPVGPNASGAVPTGTPEPTTQEAS